MKKLVFVCGISLLAGCSTPREYRPMENGDFYMGGGATFVQRLSMDDSIRSIRAAQIAGAGKTTTETYNAYTDEGDSFHLLLGYQVSEVLDLEAMIHTNDGNPLVFSSTHTLYDPRIDRPPLFGLHEARIDGELRESGAMLTALSSWRLHEYFHLFARVGASYNQTHLKSRLEEDTGCRVACSPATFVSQVKYRTEDVHPVWGVGITVVDAVRFEYLARKIPIGSTASEVSTSSYGDFEAAKIGGSETLHSLMFTLRFGLKSASAETVP